MCNGESATQGAPGGARRRPGGFGGSKIAPRLQRPKKSGGDYGGGVLSLKTSEFWRPDLGDLEAKNLDSLEDNTLVAKNVPSTAWWPHKGAGGFSTGLF